jgi:hypothetical protein
MCLLRRRSLDPASRRLFAAGNFCLFSSLALASSVDGLGHRHPAVFLGLRVLLLCSAIGLLFRSARRSGSCAARG